MTQNKRTSPSSIPSNTEESSDSFDAWKKQSLVGKMWEVFWTPENDARRSRTPSSPTCTNNEITDGDEYASFDADWYDARITSYLPDIDMFEVAFVGEDKVHLMSLNPKFVRPLEGSGPDYYEPNREQSFGSALQPFIVSNRMPIEVDVDWANSVVGKEVEIFWEEESNVDTWTEEKSSQRISMLDENSGYCSDWYDARIESFDSATGFFNVTFFGDKHHYEMTLKEEKVRPSVRAWVNRTVDILNLTLEQMSNHHDQKMLQEELLYGMTSNMSGNNEYCRPGYEDDRGMVRIELLLQQQLVLLPNLKFGSCDVKDPPPRSKTFDPFSKAHVDYLTNRIHLGLEVCQWYSRHRWNTYINEVLYMQNTENNVDYEYPKISIKDLYSSILDGLKLFMKLLPFDCSSKPRMKSKRTHSETLTIGINSSSKRLKRQQQSRDKENEFHTGNKKKLFDKDAFLSNLAACETPNDDYQWNKIFACLSNAHLGQDIWQLSPKIVNILHREFDGKCCPRFLSHKISNALETLLNRVWLPVMEWIESAKNAVGEVYGMQMDQLESVAQAHIKPVEKFARPTKCSVKEIKKCIEALNVDELLKRINLDMYLNFLIARMKDIETFQKEARDTIINCINDELCLQSVISIVTRDGIEQNDSTLHKFYSLLQHEACPRSDCVEQSSKHLTETTIQDAIELRRWIILCKWILTKRERKIAVEEAIEQQPKTTLAIPSKCENERDLSHDYLILQLKRRLSLLSTQTYAIDWDNLNSESCCKRVMNEIRTANILLEDEERLALMADAFAWHNHATSIFSGKVDFKQVEIMHKTLLDLKKGISPSRTAMTEGILQDKRIDSSIANFASRQILFKFSEMDKLVTQVFQLGWVWSKKAKHVIHTLKHHGNSSLSRCSIGGVQTKVSTVIDLKTIEELLNDHDNGLFDFPYIVKHLRNVRNDANNWVQEFLSLLPIEPSTNKSPDLLLLSLQEKIAARPKGITMFPSRQLTNDWIKILDWYVKCKLLLDDVRNQIGTQGTIPEKSNTAMQDLISIGAEILKSPPAELQTSVPCEFHVNLSHISESIQIHESTLSCISLPRIYSCRYSAHLLQSMLDFDYRLGLKGNIFQLKFWSWKNEASNFINQAKQSQFQKGSHYLPSMETAKLLLDSLILPQCLEKLAEKDEILYFTYSSIYIPLQSLFREADKIYSEVLELFNEVTSISQETTLECIEKLLVKLKIVRSRVKAVHDQGIGFSCNISTVIEKYVKNLNWIRSTFDYPFIRDYRYNFSRRGPNNNGIPFESLCTSKRISHSCFMQLYDKAPVCCRTKESTTELDHELKSLYTRTTIINNQISEWQNEVHNYMPWALRVSKRRDIISRYLSNQESQDYDIITETDLQSFLQHPLLRCVSMPEEEVIREALLFTTSMRERLLIIFGIDHLGFDTDRFTIPWRASLVGDSGEFYLYRVTQSSAFLKLKMELDGMESYANSLPVKTVDKVTYSWIVDVVKWIESVAEAVFIPEPFMNKVCISVHDAKLLIENGRKVFFELTDESKKYLLHHRLSVNTRSSTGNVHVKNCKGGSNHSIGCSVLRWVAFCYNGLRNDLISTELWTNKAKQTTDVETLRSLLDEARYDLIISPDINILEHVTRAVDGHSTAAVKEEDEMKNFSLKHNLFSSSCSFS